MKLVSKSMKNPLKFGAVRNLCLAVSASSLFFTSCSSSDSFSSAGTSSLQASMKRYEDYNLPATLPTNPANVSVKVSLTNRMAYVMEGDKPLLVMPVTVGKSSSPTPTGTFRINSKTHRYRANTHGYAINGNVVRPVKLKNKPAGWSFKGTPMPYWSSFKTGYGFHTGWMKPYPASGGCLRMHKNVAPKFFRLVSTGTKVSIANTQPLDSTIGRNVPRPPDATPFPGNPDDMMALTDNFFTMHQTPTYTN